MNEIARYLGMLATSYAGIYLSGRIVKDYSDLSISELVEKKTKIDSSKIKKSAYLFSGLHGALKDEIRYRKRNLNDFPEASKDDIELLMKL